MSQQFQFDRPINPFVRRLTPMVKMLLIVTGAVFIVQTMVDRQTQGFFSRVFGLSWEYMSHGSLWQPFTYMFLHSFSSIWHILINMLMLYFFGCEMEETLGPKRFLKLYFGAGVLGGLGWVLMTLAMRESGVVCIGASGAVYGVMGAFGAMFPDKVITLLVFFVLPVSMKARTLVIGLAVITVAMLLMADGNIAHAAHLFGGIAGYVYGRRMAGRMTFDGRVPEEPGGGGLAAWWANQRAGFRRRKMKIATPVPDAEPPDQEEVDRILEKISSQGISSLSSKERKILERAAGDGGPAI